MRYVRAERNRVKAMLLKLYHCTSEGDLLAKVDIDTLYRQTRADTRCDHYATEQTHVRQGNR
jgi:hypothetical protein